MFEGKKKKIRFVILFNDIILVTKKESKKGKGNEEAKFEYKRHLPLREATINPVDLEGTRVLVQG